MKWTMPHLNNKDGYILMLSVILVLIASSMGIVMMNSASQSLTSAKNLK